MEEIYDQIERYIDILKGNIQEQKIRRQTLKEERAEQNLQDKVKDKLKNK